MPFTGIIGTPLSGLGGVELAFVPSMAGSFAGIASTGLTGGTSATPAPVIVTTQIVPSGGGWDLAVTPKQKREMEEKIRQWTRQRDEDETALMLILAETG